MLLQIHNNKFGKEKGFTLVELAIVLVIVGLLIGGILVAKSMVETSKVTSQIRQISHFDAAVANFITTYKYPPGDASTMGCTTNLCNDGNINDSFTAGFANYPNAEFRIWNFNYEVANFWVHLSRHAPIEPGVTYTATVPAGGFTTTAVARNSPQAVISKHAGIIAGSIRMQPAYSSFSIYVIADYRPLTNADPRAALMNNIMTPSQALAIDTKIDDASPHGTGNGGVYPALAPVSYWGAHDTTSCVSAGVYRTTDTISCALAIRIMHGAGGMPNRRTDW